jgi:hypothetical protein
MKTEDKKEKMKSVLMPESRGSGIYKTEFLLLIGQPMGRDILFILPSGLCGFSLARHLDIKQKTSHQSGYFFLAFLPPVPFRAKPC